MNTFSDCTIKIGNTVVPWPGGAYRSMVEVCAFVNLPNDMVMWTNLYEYMPSQEEIENVIKPIALASINKCIQRTSQKESNEH